jgi:hypothetical protein
VTIQSIVVVPPTLVAWSTPGPVRWKLWSGALSLTVIVYVPGAMFVTGEPSPCLSSMLALASTVANSVPLAAPGEFPAARARTDRGSAANSMTPSAPRRIHFTLRNTGNAGERISCRNVRGHA